MESTKKYYAFISYKREDEWWAKWLQRKLEHYKLPTNLNGRTDLPKEIRPIFRDKSDLAGGVLADEINNALKNSQYLIVICSPQAAQSEWVGKEVQTFIDMGRTDKIIPFIVGGEPHSENLEEECLPLLLKALPKEQELLGVNINEMGRDAAAVKVVARMFGLRFDELWQRHEREQRRKRFLIIAAALLLALVGVGVAVGFSRQNKRISEQNDKIVLQNEEISKKNDEVSKQYAEISKKNERLQNDSLIMAAQLDSINRRDALIEKQQDSISSTNKNLATANRSLESANKNLETAKGNLETANEKLEQERDNLAKTIWKMKEKESKIMAKEIMALADEDSYLAQKLALEFLPKDINNPTDRPYTPEAEQALRNICEKDNVVFKYPNNVRFVSYNEEDNKIISVTNDAVFVTNVYDGSDLLKIEFHEINDADVSSSGKLIAIATDSTIKILNVENGIIVQTLNAKTIVNNVSLSFDGTKALSITQDSILTVWNVKTGKQLFAKYGVYAESYVSYNDKIADFSPDGSKIIYVINQTKKDIVTRWFEYPRNMNITDDGLSWSGKTLIKGKNVDNLFVVADSENGCILKTWKGPYDEIVYVTYSHNGKHIVSTDNNRDIIVWDAEKGTRKIEMKWEQNSVATSVVFNKDDTNLATSHVSGYIKIWDALSGIIIKEWKGHKYRGNSIAYAHDDNGLISGSLDATVKLWNLKSNVISNICSDFSGLFITPDRKNILVISNLGYCRSYIFNIETGESSNYLMLKNIMSIYDAEISPDGKLVLYTPYDLKKPVLEIHDLETGLIMSTLSGHSGLVDYCSFSSDCKRVFTSSEDGTTRIWDVESGNELKQFPFIVKSVIYNMDKNKIVMALHENNNVFVFDADSYNLLNKFALHSAPVLGIRLTPDGDIVTIDANGLLKIWDIESGNIIHTFKGCLCANNTTFSPDGKYLITQVDENVLYVWDVENDGCVHTIEQNEGIFDFSFTNDGKNIIVVLIDGVVCQYDFPLLQELIDQTRERFKNRPLTDEERKMYYLE